ncbi:2'-5' RNA ligase family protein [Glaciibacter psychrotolerans]|uniref:2'-5' RNA ligase n=1 Tax=Glaciibacter psychrotolerans TaxID=670054 RepID=A0A7Z0EFR2_9MICO|nr:2'-5' RNA ligase family protein [Leifsonia psychrotolerans]NYJ20129.1 2'-5' RNA ligase [Leifsonia psychrotolerans]
MPDRPLFQPMHPSRLVIVLPLAPLQVGDSFAVHSWPLHITVLAPFRTDAAAVEIQRALASVAATQPAITIVAAREELFGRRHDVPVTVVAPNQQLVGLRTALVRAVQPLASLPEESAFTAPGFRPHITHKRAARAQPGDEFTLTQLAIVDMAARADPTGRTVLATLPLGGA